MDRILLEDVTNLNFYLNLLSSAVGRKDQKAMILVHSYISTILVNAKEDYLYQ
jgi:hypothetical protein